MNNNATVPFCQFSNQRPLAYQWFTKYLESCKVSPSEFLVLYTILSEVEALDSDNTWGYHGQCCLSIQVMADKWNMSLATVRNAINTLELSGIITVQHSRGRSTNTITVTPHTEWVVTDFRELRGITRVKRSPIPTHSHAVTDTVTDTSKQGDIIPLQTNKTTPTPTPTPSRSPIPLPIPKPKSKLDTATDTNGNGYRHNPYANNLPSTVIHSHCPEEVYAKYGNGKRSPIPSADTVTDTVTDTATSLTLPVMDTNGNAVDTVTISVGKSKSKSKSRKYSPSPSQYEDSDNDSLPIFGMSYLEYRSSELWHRK